MGVCEDATLATLSATRDILHAKVTQYGGRIVGSAGDGFLAEFASVVDAVNCAVDVQRDLAAYNGELQEDRRLRFRIGINLGDIIVAGDDIFGDGVNLAARLEKLAEPGSICISSDVYNQVKNKLPLNFSDMGEQVVKNFAQPVRVYRITLGRPQPMEELYPVQVLPNKPSLAVLPFVNGSDDRDLDHISDGLAEDIIAELSRFRDLFVVARNSSFVFHDADRELDEVARRLGVRCLVLGQVRPGGNGAVLEARLVDAPSGQVLWERRYECGFPEVFDALGDAVQGIATTLLGPQDERGFARSRRTRAANLEAYEALLRGRELFGHITPADDQKARLMFARAVELDANCSQAYAMLAVTHMYEFRQTRQADPAERAVKCAKAALAMDDDDATAHQVLGYISLYRKRFLQAQFHMSKAVGLDPNDSVAQVRMGLLHCYLGKPSEALDYFQRSSRLNPCHPGRHLGVQGIAYFVARRYDDAILALGKLPSPHYWDCAYLAAAYAMRGRIDEGRAALSEVLQAMPAFAMNKLAAAEPFQSVTELTHFVDAMHKAGLPA